jgi:hypothetical protein
MRFYGEKEDGMTSVLEPGYATNSVGRCPAPWSLRGSGYILLYRFPTHFALEAGRIPPFLRTLFAGGLGAVMLVDYAESNAGPYGELLFMPGKFRFRGKKLACITKIYVSTRESVVNGWENWAIPKERADLCFTAQKARRMEQVVVTRDGDLVLEATLRHSRLSFPIHTGLLPFPLVQDKNGELYYTSFTGKGTAQLAHIEDMRVNPDLFPDIHPYQPLIGMHLARFEVTFPPARITGL